jgi:hypothetical protein
MNHRITCAAGALIAAAALTACESSKSSTPLSPSIAGPIAGVEISAPKMLEPIAGQKIAVDRQPLTLLIENASSTGVRPLSYSFELATDAAFNTKVFTRDGVPPGEGGRTSLRLPDALATGRTYFWRARALDGANIGPYANPMSFDIFTPIVIQEPVLVSPAPNATVDSLRPRFTFNNVLRSGPVGAITYLIEVADTDAFNNKLASWTGAEQANQTALTLPVDLQYNKIYYWHVRAADPSTVGPFSLTRAFVSPPVPVVTPEPTPLPTPGGPVAANDMVSLSSATILNSPRDLARWPVTTAISLIDIRSNGVHAEFSKRNGPGRWPDFTPPGWDGPLQYTLGMLMNIGGQWYASAPVEFWFGLDYAGGPPSQYAQNWFYDPGRWAPMTYHQPQVGEQIGFFVCAGDCRNTSDGSKSPVKERSNVVIVSMPSDGGATFRF